MATVRKRRWKRTGGKQEIAWIVDFMDASGNRDRKQFNTKPEADAFRIKVESELRVGAYRPDAAKVTVKEAGDLFIEHCRTRMQRRERMTRRNFAVYEGHIRNYICPDPDRHANKKRRRRLTPFTRGIGDCTLRELTAGRIETLCDDLKKAGRGGRDCAHDR